MEDFELKLKISPSDTKFKKLIGKESYEKIRLETFKKDRFSCRGCGFHPLDESRALIALTLHVIEIKEEKPEDSECAILCLACHSTQHIDVAIEKGWVQLVNSINSQKTLTEMCRVNAIHNNIKEDTTKLLKTPSLEFLKKMKDGTLPSNTKAKVIFTNKFEWGDL